MRNKKLLSRLSFTMSRICEALICEVNNNKFEKELYTYSTTFKKLGIALKSDKL